MAISIVTYNSQDVFATLDNLLAEVLPHFPSKIYLFDNGSDLAYQEKLRTYPKDKVDVLFFGENHGFGFGHNKNVTRATEDLVLICNPDILISQVDFKHLYDYLSGHDNMLIAPKIVNTDMTPQHLMRRKLDVFDYMLRFVPFQFVKKIFHKRLAYYECRDITDETQAINFVSGCFMMTNRQDYLDIGGFDECFFMYFEDNDLCQRYREAGKAIMYLPDAKAIHFYGKGAHRHASLFRVFMSSMAKYFNKWGWRFF